MAIIPLWLFGEGELPGVTQPRLYPPSDITSYWRILRSVSSVADHCISRFVAANRPLARPRLRYVSETGWHPVGKQISMGFVSGSPRPATDISAMNRATRGHRRLPMGYRFPS